MFMSESRYYQQPAKMIKIEHDGNNNEFFSYENHQSGGGGDYYEPFTYAQSTNEQFFEQVEFAQQNYSNADASYYYYATPAPAAIQQDFAYNSTLIDNCLSQPNSYALNSSSSSSNANYGANNYQECYQSQPNQIYSQNFVDEYFYPNGSKCYAANYHHHASSSNSEGSLMFADESDDSDDEDEGFDCTQISDIVANSMGVQKRKRKRVLNKIQRAEATQREKRRMLKLNRAFEELRKVLPITEFAKNKLSRAETLKSAIEYIDRLAQLLN